MDDDPVATRRLQVQQRQLEEDVRIIQNQIASLMQTRCVGGFQSANSPQVMLAAAARDGTPTVEDVRMLRQRVERIEALGNGPHDVQHLLADDHAYGAKSNLEVKVDMLQHVLDKVLVGQQAGTPRGRTTQHDVTTTTDIRKVYNDMMIEDIDAQLQGRMPGMAGSQAPAYLPTGLRTAIQSMVGGMISTVKDQIEKWASSQLGYQRDQLGALNTATAEQLLGVQSKMSMIEETLSGLHHHHIFQRDKDASQHTPERANQLQSALAAISNLEQSVHNVQNTVTSHGSRLQNAELSLDNHVSELQNTLGDLRSRVDGAVTRFGTSVMDIEQRLMKDVTDAAARVTVADQRINHLDNRLNEDADRIHRLEDRVEQSVRQLQDRVDEQGQKIFDSERKLAQTLDEKVAVMRQIAELSEKQTLEVERKWHEAEALLKSQLRAALQQHIEGLEEVLQCMRNDLRGIEERVGMAETIGADAKNHASALDQRTMMLEKSLEALRTGFETYVHDGTVHIMQAHNERMEELRDKLGHELDLFDGRIKSIELQRKAADEELATALEKIQIAVAGQPSHERIEKALQSLEENKVRPAMETAVKSYELARELHIIPQRMDQLGEQVHACMVDNKAQIDAHREKSMEISMLKDQVMILRDQMQHSYHPPPVQSPPPPMPSGPATSGGNPQFEAEASRRLSELERQITDISTLRQDTTSLREELRVIREQRAAAPVSQPQAYSPPPSTTQAAPASGGDDQLRARIDAVEARLSEFDSKLEEQDQVTQEMVDTIAEHHTTIQSLRSKSKDTSGDADFELITADISKLKRTLSDVRKDVDVLKGWKTGKEGDAAVMERTARDVTDLKNKVSQLQLDVASIKPSD
ncbi:hypothetical protein DIPPA_08500 [Diplonema papillatum]|nr:hypothetical protein DIPPA_08500 [Diplonema papillatum]